MDYIETELENRIKQCIDSNNFELLYDLIVSLDQIQEIKIKRLKVLEHMKQIPPTNNPPVFF